MSDDLNISYSYQAPSPQPIAAPEAAEQLLAFSNCDRVELGNGNVLLMDRDSGRQLAVAPEVATALTYCHKFAPLQEHAQGLIDALPQLQGQVSDAKRVLTMVKEAGFMLDAADVASRLAQPRSPAPAPAPTRVFIISCDRPDAVERLLDSLLQSSRLAAHDELFLVDDSRDTANRERNRELLLKFNLSSTKTMHYLGADAQHKLLTQLAGEHPGDEAGLRFLIDRQQWSELSTYGLARNLCLLMSVGYRCLILDDDILCRTVTPPGQKPAATFGGGNSRELACFGSEAQLLQQAVYADTDPLSGHAQCLGMNLGQALAELDSATLDPAVLRGVNAALFNALDAESPVLISQCGSWGDPGIPGDSWFRYLGEPSIERILAAPGGLAGALQNRHYWLGRRSPNIGKMAVMSQATGLDNSALLPPYFPACRGEDYLFASMSLYLHPTMAVLDYNWSVPHLPLEQRESSQAEDAGVPRGSLGLCGRYLADHTDLNRGVSAETRITGLASLLRDLSERDSASLLATFRAELTRERAEAWQQANTRLQQSTAQENAQWQEFLRRQADALAASCREPARLADVPEVPEATNEEQLLLSLKRGLADFSTALIAWPRLRASASDISRLMLDNGDMTP